MTASAGGGSGGTAVGVAVAGGAGKRRGSMWRGGDKFFQRNSGGRERPLN